MRPFLPLLALVLAAPLAAAQDATLASFEEPHKGFDKVWDFVVLEEESEGQRIIVFRNPVTQPFGVTIYDAQGEEVWVRNGSRGVQTLPSLEPGSYRFFVRNEGEFQVTDKALERGGLRNVSATLEGTDAYVLAPTRGYAIDFTGDVDVETWDLTQQPSTARAPLTYTVEPGKAYVFTLRGDEGAAYAISMTPTGAAPTQQDDETPGAAPTLVALAVVGLALALRHRRR